MIRTLAAALTLASGWSLTEVNLDRLRWNARERTATGIERLETEDKEGAVEALETAAGLDFDDPALRFNAGSAHLIAGSEGALEHLERAAQDAPGALRAPASYNLGNARLGAGDTVGAIQAYEETLRIQPGHQDAKFNLELALKQQEEQQKQQEQEQEQEEEEQQEQDGEGEDQQQPQQPQPDQDQEGNEEQDGNEPNQPEQEEQQNQNDEGEQEPEPDGNGREPQLPQFDEQPDMTAEQAAAILEAVENLEREQRRKQAEEEMKKRPRKGKDW